MGVEAAAGVRVLLGGAGDADCLSKVRVSPVFGFLMTRGAAFFFWGG